MPSFNKCKVLHFTSINRSAILNIGLMATIPIRPQLLQTLKRAFVQAYFLLMQTQVDQDYRSSSACVVSEGWRWRPPAGQVINFGVISDKLISAATQTLCEYRLKSWLDSCVMLLRIGMQRRIGCQRGKQYACAERTQRTRPTPRIPALNPDQLVNIVRSPPLVMC